MFHVLRGVLLACLLAQPLLAQGKGLSICFREDAPPFSFLDDAGKPSGYTVDLCTGVAARMGHADPAMVPVTSETRFEVLGAQGCDMLCGATTVTIKRRETMDFSLITFVTDTALLFPTEILKSRPVGDRPLSVGYLENTTTKDNINTGRVLTGDPASFKFEPISTHQDAADAILAGKLDAYVADREILNQIFEQKPDLSKTHMISRRGLSYEPYAIAIARDRPGADDLRRDLDRHLADMFRDGTALSLVETHVPNRLKDEVLEALFEIQSLPE